DVLLEVGTPLRPRDGDDVRALREHPGEGELSRRAALLGGDRLDTRDEVQVALKVVALEARRHAAIVVGRQILEATDLAGEETPSERAVGDEADLELAAGCKDVVF